MVEPRTIAEAGSLNLMSFVGNNGVNAFDVLGLLNSAGHFYTTYFGCTRSGPERRRRL